MNRTKLMINVIAILVAGLAMASVAQAQATRTWVSGVGDDANPCSRTAPCKTFAGAISKTAPAGEINVLDPGGFGALTITKSITISAECLEAGVLVSGTNGIVVNALSTDTVTLRGLDFNGLNNSPNGINILLAKQVHIERCRIYEFTGADIAISVGNNAVSVDVKDTIMLGPNSKGCQMNSGAAGSPSVSFYNCKFQGCTQGLDVQQGVASVSNCIFTHNSNIGVLAEGQGGQNALIQLESNIITENVTGVGTTTGASTITVSNCSIFSNTTGVAIPAGTVQTYLNNRVSNNTNNTAMSQINPS
jgi:hypothetical protein